MCAYSHMCTGACVHVCTYSHMCTGACVCVQLHVYGCMFVATQNMCTGVCVCVHTVICVQVQCVRTYSHVAF